jgi:NAD(P)-dependent dehydrogenase (short-subunit alcohol dehydrogenase family)
MEDLRGQHVLVTGATGPVGRACVETLLASGATVSAASRRRTALDALRADLRHHDRLHVAEGDVAEGASVEMLFDALERGTGALHGVVHTVGGFAYGPLVDTSAATIDTLYRALFLTSALVTRAALRRMAPRGAGRVVLIGGHASTRPAPNMAVYGAMKAAVAHFVQSVDAEMRDTDVTVNAILPGLIDTPDNRRNMPGSDPLRWVAPLTIAKAVCALLGESGRGVRGALVTIPDRVS